MRDPMKQTEQIEQMERELAQPLADFKTALVAMAEHHSQQTQPLLYKAKTAAAGERWFRSRWALRLAPVSLLIALTIGLVMANEKSARPAPSDSTSTASMQTDAAANPAQVSDTALFSEIDQDLSANVPQPMAPLEGATLTNKTTHANQTQVEDENAVEK